MVSNRGSSQADLYKKCSDLSRPGGMKHYLLQWESLLLILFVAINIINSILSSNYFNIENIANVMIMFLDKAIMVYPVMMVLLLGEIDISTSSIIPLSCVVAALLFEQTSSIILSVIAALLIGLLCGLFNGVLLTSFPELNSTIVTLGNQILFRGLAYMLVEDKAIKSFAKSIRLLAWGDVAGFPVILCFFFVETLLFAYIVHRSKFGRRVYAIGSNKTASSFSGININNICSIVYLLSGLFASIAGLFLIAKLGSVRANIARGYEMEVIAMAVLGGTSTAGGKGTVYGALLGAFTIGMLRYGLGLVNVSAQVLMIIIGLLLIISVAISNRTLKHN